MFSFQYKHNRRLEYGVVGLYRDPEIQATGGNCIAVFVGFDAGYLARQLLTDDGMVDIVVGQSFCHPEDNYNKATARRLAEDRATSRRGRIVSVFPERENELLYTVRLDIDEGDDHGTIFLKFTTRRDSAQVYFIGGAE